MTAPSRYWTSPDGRVHVDLHDIDAVVRASAMNVDVAHDLSAARIEWSLWLAQATPLQRAAVLGEPLPSEEGPK